MAIKNAEGEELADKIKERIYSDKGIWEDPESYSSRKIDCNAIISNLSERDRKRFKVYEKTYDSQNETHRMLCNVKSFNDPNRFIDITKIEKINGNLYLNGAGLPCLGGQYRSLSPGNGYPVIYIILLAHMYNKYVDGNNDPSKAVKINYNYTPKKTSEYSSIWSLPCMVP